MLSVVLTTHNEEKNLGRCLESIIQLAGEVIVVDGSSTDATVAIAQSYGAKVISTTNKSNFHINKQQAMDAATGALVLQLDADEVVDEDLYAFIAHLLQEQELGRLPTEPVAWYCKRRNYFMGTFLRKGGQYPDPVIRLYVRGRARLPQKNVHEQMQVEGSVGTAEGHLLHYAFPDFATYMRKFNTYTSFEAERLRAAGFRPSLAHTVRYWMLKPLSMFFSLYIRHRGYVDGMPGFLFALMSALHHPFVYMKVQEYSTPT